jgi:hypothetical protein
MKDAEGERAIDDVNASWETGTAAAAENGGSQSTAGE